MRGAGFSREKPSEHHFAGIPQTEWNHEQGRFVGSAFQGALPARKNLDRLSR